MSQPQITSTHNYSENALFVDTDRAVWVMSKLFIKKSKRDEFTKTTPIVTGIVLQENELIKDFYCTEKLCIFVTSTGSLYSALHGKKKLSGKVKKSAVAKSCRQIQEAKIVLTPEITDLVNRIIREIGRDETWESSYYSVEQSAQLFDTIPDKLTDEATLYQFIQFIDQDADIFDSIVRKLFSSEITKLFGTTLRFSEILIGIYNQLVDKDVSIPLYLENPEWTLRDHRKNDIVPSYQKPLSLFELVTNDVDRYSIYDSRIFFTRVSNQKLHLFSQNLLTHSANSTYLHHAHKVNLICCVPYDVYLRFYEINLPFSTTEMVFCSNLIYIPNGEYHHVITTSDKLEFDMLVFRTDIPVNPQNLGYVDNTKTLLLSHSGIYQYSEMDNGMVRIRDDSDFLYIENYQETYRIYSCSFNRLYRLTIETRTMPHKFHSERVALMDSRTKSIVDTNDYRKVMVCEINSDELFYSSGTYLFANSNMMKSFSYIKDNLAYQTHDDRIYLVREWNSKLDIADQQFVKSVGPKMDNSSREFNLYELINLPDGIITVHYTWTTIILTTNNGVFRLQYGPAPNFVPIHFGKFSQPLQVNHRLIEYRTLMKVYTHIDINADTTGELYFNKLMSLTEMFGPSEKLVITYTSSKQRISHGDSVSYDFINLAMVDFANRFLVVHNVLTEFKPNVFDGISVANLQCIGDSIHNAIRQLRAPLCIRLPPIFLVEIYRRFSKEITIEELEYYAKLEDAIAFEAAFVIKDQPEKIRESGFESYEDCLKFLCKLTDRKDIMAIITIVNGFFLQSEIPNGKKMNLLTIDHYLHGAYQIDRTCIINYLQITGPKLRNKVSEIFIKRIREIPESDLKILLKNWTCIPGISKGNYFIKFESSKSKDEPLVSYSTCFRQIELKNFNLSTDEKINECFNQLIQPEMAMQG